VVAAEQRDADDKNAVLITRLAAQLRFTSRENHLPGERGGARSQPLGFRGSKSSGRLGGRRTVHA